VRIRTDILFVKRREMLRKCRLRNKQLHVEEDHIERITYVRCLDFQKFLNLLIMNFLMNTSYKAYNAITSMNKV
jgi:hypothetical protein